jgi:hypothetical protein
MNRRYAEKDISCFKGRDSRPRTKGDAHAIESQTQDDEKDQDCAAKVPAAEVQRKRHGAQRDIGKKQEDSGKQTEPQHYEGQQYARE